MKRLYHGTPYFNFDAIMENGTIEPGMDGHVHLTTSKWNALQHGSQYGCGTAIFCPVMKLLDKSKLTNYTFGIVEGDECYCYEGVLSVKLHFLTAKRVQWPEMALSSKNGRGGPEKAENAERYKAFLKREGLIE